jgi:hypothetical protein
MSLLALPAALDRWLFAPGTNHRAAIVRRGLAITIALRAALGPFRELAGQPASLFRPPPLLTWLPSMPPAGVLFAVQALAVIAAVCVLADRRPAVAFAVGWASLLFLAGCKDSLGKILHNDVLLLLTCVPVLLVPAAARVRDRTRTSRAGVPVRAAMVVIALAYFTAGVEKLAVSGLSWVTSDNMRWVMYQAASSERMWFRSFPIFVADRAWLSHLVAAGILVTELSAPLILVSRRFRTVFVGLAVALHLGTWLTLGLDYWAWILTVAVVLADWDRLLPARDRAREPDAGPQLATAGARG